MNEPAPAELLTSSRSPNSSSHPRRREDLDPSGWAAGEPARRRRAPRPHVSCPSGGSGRVCRSIPEGARIAEGRQRRRSRGELGRDAIEQRSAGMRVEDRPARLTRDSEHLTGRTDARCWRGPPAGMEEAVAGVGPKERMTRPCIRERPRLLRLFDGAWRASSLTRSMARP
jgi:hypothetical protein